MAQQAFNSTRHVLPTRQACEMLSRVSNVVVGVLADGVNGGEAFECDGWRYSPIGSGMVEIVRVAL